MAWYDCFIPDDIRQNGILGNVRDGWFAQVAHFGENVGSHIWGDGVYQNMDRHAATTVNNRNQANYDRYIAQGYNPTQALQMCNADLEGLVHPRTPGQLWDLTSTGTVVATQAVGDSLRGPGTDWSKILPWVLGGAAVLGGGLLLADSTGGNSSLPRRSGRRRDRDRD